MAKKKRKRRKRTSKIKSISVPEIENKSEERKKFPKELINAFINMCKSKTKIRDYGIEYYSWTDKSYKKFKAEADKFLGKNASDPLENGKLVVLLSKATMDLRDVKKEKKKG